VGVLPSHILRSYIAGQERRSRLSFDSIVGSPRRLLLRDVQQWNSAKFVDIYDRDVIRDKII